MKKFLCFFITFLLLGIGFYNKDIIIRFIAQKVIYRDSVVVNSANEYYKNSNFLLTQNTNQFIIKNNSQFINIIYTVLNNGWNEFTFFCDYTYENCTDDFYDIIENSTYIEAINNYVNPLNSYNNINFTIDNFGKITMNIEKNYTDKQIKEVNNIINKFIRQNIDTKMDDYQKIKLFHDFVIENTVYDQNFKLGMNKETYAFHPYNAYGTLVEGKAICSGYSDAMAIFLDKIGVKNYRIASDEHIWNLIYLDNNWYHLDLTWDDPVTSNGQQVILDDFFLITTEQLHNKDTKQHTYNNNLYLEAK